jgi:hypothetical protein
MMVIIIFEFSCQHISQKWGIVAVTGDWVAMYWGESKFSWRFFEVREGTSDALM